MASTTLEKARIEAEVSEPEVVTERSGSILRVHNESRGQEKRDDGLHVYGDCGPAQRRRQG